MRLSPAEARRSTWRAIYRRKGADGIFTRIFDALDAQHQAALLSFVSLRPTELAVIGSLRDPYNWLLLTTERLVWAFGADRRELENSAIAAGTRDKSRPLKSPDEKMHYLAVRTLEREDYSLDLEAGDPVCGVWHILDNIGRRNYTALGIPRGQARVPD